MVGMSNKLSTGIEHTAHHIVCSRQGCNESYTVQRCTFSPSRCCHRRKQRVPEAFQFHCRSEVEMRNREGAEERENEVLMTVNLGYKRIREVKYLD